MRKKGGRRGKVEEEGEEGGDEEGGDEEEGKAVGRRGV